MRRALGVVILVTWATVAMAAPPGTWRYRKPEKKVKVAVIAGSIGAWPSGSFSDFIGGACPAIEVKNLSEVGLGAVDLKLKYKREVIDNRGLRLSDKGVEHWLLASGGLNSIGNAELTIQHTADLFALAHGRGVKVVALSVTPWGGDKDRRWQGLRALETFDKTRRVVDFVLGRLSRAEALGKSGAPAWTAAELPDVGVNLFDAPALRQTDAKTRDVALLRKALGQKKAMATRHADLDAAARRAAEVPRWFLKRELRSFDPIHPNTEGHRAIATIACPSLPKSWQCDCAVIPRLVWKGHIERP